MSSIGAGLVGFVTLANNTTALIQPPSGEEWLLRDIAQGTGTAGVLELGIVDSGNYAPVRFANSATWGKALRLFITNAKPARVGNTSGFTQILVYNAVVTAIPGVTAGRADAKSGTFPLAASASVIVQPPVGQVWSVLEVGSAATFTFSGSTYPNVVASISDGTNTQSFYFPSGDGFNRPWTGFISNTNYLVLFNQSGSTVNVGYAGVRIS